MIELAPHPMPPAEVFFVVHGKPQPAGSKKAFALRRRDGSPVLRPNGAPVVNVVDDNPESKAWKREVAKTAMASGATILDGPVAVTFVFFRPRPKSHTRADGSLSTEGARNPYPTSKPDVLKLARAIEDALTSVVYHDDAQIVDEIICKRWGEPSRVAVFVGRHPDG